MTRLEVLQQAVACAWSQPQIGAALGVTRERARQLLHKHGLFRDWEFARAFFAPDPPPPPPNAICCYCGREVEHRAEWKNRRTRHPECRQAWVVTTHTSNAMKRYRTDPDYRARKAKWQRDNPEKVSEMNRRYLENIRLTDPVRYAQFLAKERARYHANKALDKEGAQV